MAIRTTPSGLAYSRLLLEEVTGFLGQDVAWIADKTIVTLGCGCTGDLAAFPAAVKIAIDPLLYVYQQLGMLMETETGNRTVYLSLGAENLPLLDNFADLVICRNALDHMPEPTLALKEIWRVLKTDGALFVSVDIGGAPRPDEPTVFSLENLRALLRQRFDVATPSDDAPPHSAGRRCRVRAVARKRPRAVPLLDKDAILRAYEARLS